VVMRCGSGTNARSPAATAAGATPAARARAAAASALAVLCGAAGRTSSTWARVTSPAPNARSTSAPSTTPRACGGGAARVKPTRRQPAAGADERSRSPVIGSSRLCTATASHRSYARAFACAVGLHRAVPVGVVLGDVEHDRGVGPGRVDRGQLEAAQLDGEHVVALLAGHHRHQRQPDVARRDRAASVGEQHGLQHPGRGRLAVRPGDDQPAGRPGPPHPPGQLDLAPHRDAEPRRVLQQEGGRPPAGRDHDEVGLGGQPAGRVLPELDAGAGGAQLVGRPGRATLGGRVHRRHPGPTRQQRPGRRRARPAQPGHHDVPAGHVGCRLRHETTTHSA
jgi:hypothetical protein